MKLYFLKIRPNVLFLLLLGTAVTAQVPDLQRFVPGPTGESVRHLLACEDANGYLWIGTDQGLLRFDGMHYTHLPGKEIPELEGTVTAMYLDRTGMLWAGFQSGAIAQLRHGREWALWNIEEGFPQAPITGFAESSDSLFWISTYGEGIYFHNGKYLYAFSEEEGLPSQDIYALATVNEEVWAATDAGIAICSVYGGRRTVRRLSTVQGLPDPVVTTLIPDGRGNCWVGMYEGGLARFDTRADAFYCPDVATWSHGEIKSLALWENKDLFIGTSSGKVFRMDVKHENIQSLPGWDGMRSRGITALHLGREGHLSVFNKERGFHAIQIQFGLVENSPANTQALLVDSQSRLWAGTPEGLFVAARHSGTFRPSGLPGHNFTSLFEDKYGNIWAGTFGQGLYILPSEGGTPLLFNESDGLGNSSILRISGRGNEIWLATLGGATALEIKGDASRLAPRVKMTLGPAQGLGAHFLYTVFADSRGRIWFGSDGKGVSKWHNGHITHYQTGYSHQKDTLSLQSVYAIAEDHEGRIWCSTAKEGLFRETAEGFQAVKKNQGREITALLGDGSGHLLMAFEGGLEWYDIRQGQSIIYGKGIGLDLLQPNLNALCTDPEGRLWLGTTQGIITFTPLNASLLPRPLTVLENVSVFLEPEKWPFRSHFSARENNLVFAFTGIWHTDPERIRFRYKLSGHNENWIYTADRQATFPNLPPGRYSFQVSAGVHEFYDNSSAVRYDFRIRPPFWRQPWFVVLAFASGAALLYWWVKYRENLWQIEAQRRKEAIEQQFELLKSQVNPHFLFNSFNTLIALIEEDSYSAVAYVEKLSDLYRNILQYRDKELILLSEELAILQDYLYLMNKRFGANLQIDIRDFPRKGFIAPLTLQLLVENAIKHNIISSTKVLRVIIDRQGDELFIENNRQSRLQPSPSTGFGLSNIKRRYALLDERPIRIEADDTSFRVVIPIISKSES